MGGAVLILALASQSFATSLWDEKLNGSRSIYTDRTAFQKGDLVTIVINQSTVVLKDQKTETDKVVSVNESFQALFQNFMGGERTAAEIARRNPHTQWSGTRAFDGSGKIQNTETLTSTIQARVTDVLPNHVMRIEATRRYEAGQEKSDMVLTGLIRQEDLTTANTVLSTQVADLQVKQITNGAISREQRKGWLTRVWETFSPF
jgi:flagellar L-ring protein precursor FlgH